MARSEVVTYAALGVFVGVLGSAVGGSWYVSRAIAEEGAKSRQAAEVMVEAHRSQVADVYARREKVEVLSTKLDQVIELQKRIIAKLDADRD